MEIANKINREPETKKLKNFLEKDLFPELKRMKLGKAQQEAIKEVIWSKVNQQISYFSNDKNREENPWEYVSIESEFQGLGIKFRIQLFVTQQVAPGIYTFEIYEGEDLALRKGLSIGSHVILESNLCLEPTEESLGNKLKSIGIPNVDEFLKENIEEIVSPVNEKPYYIEIEHADSTLVMYELRTRPNIRFFPLLDIVKNESIPFKTESDSVEFVRVMSMSRYVLKEDK